MNIALVCPYDLGVPGGVQAQAAGLARRLEREGHQAWVVGPGVQSAFADVDVRLTGPTRGLRVNDSTARIALDPRAAGKTATALAGADVVHVHEPFVPFVGWAAITVHRPRVLTFHADPSPAVAGAYRRLGRPARTLVEGAGVVTAVSPVAAAPLEAMGVSPVIIPNGVEVPPDVPAPVPGSVAFVGRDEPRKGLDVLLAAWPLVRRRHPDATLTVVGSDAPGGAPRDVRFTGRVSDGEKFAVLERAAVFAAPNRRGESFGITVAEALSRACAVVASDLPAFRFVADEAAIYVAPGDAPALASGIVELLDDETRRSRLADLGRRQALRFDWPEIARLYLETYHNALAHETSHPPSHPLDRLRRLRRR